jgi:hypothetical protein
MCCKRHIAKLTSFLQLWAFALLLGVDNQAVAQPTQLGTQTVNGSYVSYPLIDLGIFRQARVQATSSALSGTRNWEFYEAPFDYDPAWRPYSGGLTLAGYNMNIFPTGGTAAALFNTGFGGSAGLMPTIANGYYYTFNVTEYSTPGVPQNEYMGVVETSYNPVSITSVVQSPGVGVVYPENSVYVTVTTAANPSPGENIFVRYSTSVNFLTSTLLTVTMTGTTGTVEIPCQAAGTIIYYYAYSSNRTSAAILTDVGVTGERAHDMSTLNVNNNGGPNYTYTVAPSIGFCGDYYVPSICYPTINSFVSALNGGTVSCDVVCHVAAGHSETAPAGGINLTQTGTAANTITFVKDGVGANPIIYAPTGTVSMDATDVFIDGIFSLNGSDYITIDGIDLTDNNTTNPEMMEYGYGIFKTSATNGCSNNVIRNCNITLKNSNYWTGAPVNFEMGSVGILMRNSARTALTTLFAVSATSGRNQDNQFYSNTIVGAFVSILLTGYNDATSPYTYYDQNNSVGIPGFGNTLHKYGHTASTSRSEAIYAIYQNNLTITDNIISNYGSGGSFHNSTLYGIFVSSPITGNLLQTITVENNTISLLMAGVISSQMTGIKVGNSSAAASAVYINGNTIESCGHAATATGVFVGIDQAFNATVSTINNNIIQNNTLNTTTTNPSYLIYDNAASASSTVTGNQMLNNIKTGTSSGGLYGYYHASGSSTGNVYFENNIIDVLSVTAASTAYAVGARISSAIAQSKFVNDNQVSNIIGGSGTGAYTSGIIVDFMPSGSTVNNNNIDIVQSASHVIGLQCASATSVSTSSNQTYTVSGNGVTNISTTGNSISAVGIFAHALTSLEFNNNRVDGVTSTGTSPSNINGMRIGGGAVSNTFNINNCQIANVVHSNAASTGSPVGIYLFPNSNTINVFSNSIYNISGTGLGAVRGIYSTSGNGINNYYNNFIQRLSMPASTDNLAVNGIYCAAGGNTYNIYYNTIVLGKDGVLTGGTNFGACGYYHGAGLLNLRNNIIYVNATVSGTGVAACVRKGTAGTAGTPPATTSVSTTTNNNFYYINTGAYNYVYVEGSSTANIKNGYAYSGATTNVTTNLNNDPCFNILTAGDITSYKYFMSLGGGGSREVDSYYDIPHFAGGAFYPDNIKIITGATDYTESKATSIALVTTDFDGELRQGEPGYAGTGTAPDIGADEGEFAPITIACLLLPIELIEFTGWYNGNENELHWTTATEINSAYFEIQRSLNGIDFITIGITPAAGNSLSELNYLFYDDAPAVGINYYRLKMVDIDNSYEYSNMIAIRLQGEEVAELNVYPNPATDFITLELNEMQSGAIDISIIDITGREVAHFNAVTSSGINVLHYSVQHLPTASYFLQLTNKATGEVRGVQFVKY